MATEWAYGSADLHVLILAPTGRDAQLARDTLARAGLASVVCADADALAQQLACGAGAMLLAEEALCPRVMAELVGHLAGQPPWSDLPLVILTSDAGSIRSHPRSVEQLRSTASVTLLERPVRGVTLVSALRVALRARRRQYEIREHMAARERLTAELQVSEARHRELFENANDVVYTLDLDGNLTSINRAGERLIGYRREELLGSPIARLVAPSDLAPMREMLDRKLAGEPVTTYELTVQARDGRRVTLEVSSRLIVEGGRPIGVQGVARDITERRANDRMQREFLAMASHELKNPLTAIKGFAQLMQRRNAYSERAVMGIVTQANHMDRLLGDLLDVARLESGRLDLVRAPVELVGMVRACVEQTRVTANKHRIRLEAPPEHVTGSWDADRLGQVVQNLLSNAVKYSPEGGEILVQIEAMADEAYISVIDRGVGISPEALPNIFERFYRAANAADGAEGFGIGLFVARSIVELHGGQISVASEPGRGTSFRFTLPYHPPVADVAAVEAGA